MLVLTRKVNESIKIGDDIEITVTRIGASCVRLGISCPKEMNVVREELLDTETEE
jgi:carbon storage regulator